MALAFLPAFLPGCSSGSTTSLWTSGSPIPHPKQYVCYHAKAPLNIDGKLDEPDWVAVPWTDYFGDIEGSLKPTPRYRTRAKMLWNDDYFVIGAEISDPHIWATLTKRDTVIFYDNDFEVFMDPNGDNHEYYEFEMNALNTVWDLFLPKPYKDKGSAVDSWNIDGLKTGVHIYGTLNDPRDTDSCWTVEIAMPWKALSAYAHMATPPAEGDQWRVNFSRVEWTTTIENGRYVKVKGRPEDNWVWSPQWVIDMHRPELWGYVQFTRQSFGTVAPRPDSSWSTRVALMRVYYAQRAFFEEHNRWATSMEELGKYLVIVPSEAGRPAIQPSDSGYICTIKMPRPNGQDELWHVSQDSRIWHE